MIKGWQVSLIIVTSRFHPTRCVKDEGVILRAIEIWENMKATVKFLESLSKSKLSLVKSYQTLVSNISDLLVPAELVFLYF